MDGVPYVWYSCKIESQPSRGTLLELTGEILLARTRRLTNDLVSPYFISDDELFEYLSLAEMVLATQGKFIRTIATVIPTVASTPRVALGSLTPDRVREFLSVELLDGTLTTPLKIKSYQEFTASQEEGTPAEVTFGRESGYMHIRPIPSGVFDLRLTYLGLPLAMEAASDTPSIPKAWQTYLHYGAAVMALRGAEEEHHDPQRIQMLEGVWGQGLALAAQAQAVFTQDASTVQWSGNGLW